MTALPEPGISGETFEQLSRVMPGTRSFLHRHEWTKHGTCYAGEPDEYFRESVMLMDQINASAVRDYFFTNIGNTLSASDIRAKFDQAFGPGAGKKVNVKCRQGLITELWINLKGEITPQSNLGLLIEKCRTGRVRVPGRYCRPGGVLENKKGVCMSIFLVQHGQSLPKTEDPEKGLSDKGREQTLKIAQVAAGYGVNVSKIYHSGKKRAGANRQDYGGPPLSRCPN